MSIKDNMKKVRERIASAAQKTGRDPDKIKLIAVAKTVSVELIEEAIKAGITDIGENRVQEAQAKAGALRQKYPNVAWHMVGHLQRNKVKAALQVFDLIHSVDSQRLADEMEARARAEEINIPVLIEVKTSPEAAKYGVAVDELMNFVDNINRLKHLRVKGLMTVAPWFEDPEQSRPYFCKLRELKEQIEKLSFPNVEMQYLSMGMSDDFEVAISEGSNMIRIGRAIFGERPPGIQV